mgnify:CR=1 FL=1
MSTVRDTWLRKQIDFFFHRNDKKHVINFKLMYKPISITY